MSKRFFDTGIWEKPWFMELTPVEKMALMYVMAKCDNVGVWTPNYKLASFQIGSEVMWESLSRRCNGNVEILPDGKWWLVDFCNFQYGELRDECRPHQSYLSLLEKHGLKERVCLGYPRGIHTPKEKEKDNTLNLKSEKRAKPVFNREINKWENITDDMIALWEKAYPACDMEIELTKMVTWILAHPKEGQKSDWHRFIVGWLNRAQNSGGTK